MAKKSRKPMKKGKKLRAGKLQRKISTLKDALKMTRPGGASTILKW
jgi:hypothetical protein